MNGSGYHLPSIAVLKAQARRLRAKLEQDGTSITHSKSLELLAELNGLKNWNVLCAAATDDKPSYLTTIGTRVRGRYLSQQFEGEIVGIKALLSSPGRFRIALQFDNPVDVSTFAAISVLRQSVSCIIDASGTTIAKTSDGRPQLQLEGGAQCN